MIIVTEVHETSASNNTQQQGKVHTHCTTLIACIPSPELTVEGENRLLKVAI